MDLASIIASGHRYNFHSHTEYCDGRATMAEIIAAASRAGFGVWGFTPHSPIDVESPCNMSSDNVEAYLANVAALRRRYPSMDIYAGMEVDYLDKKRGPVAAAARYDLDYIIGSVHFIPNQEGVYYDIDGSPERFIERLGTVFHGDLDYVVRTFWTQTLDMIACGGLDIVGHIDKIARNAGEVRPRLETEPVYRAMADAAVRATVSAGLAIEINTKQRGTGRRFFPHPRHWAYIAASGVPMPINSDAHTTEGVDAYRADARRLLRAITALEAHTATLAVVTADDRLLTFDGRGVADLYRLVKTSPDILRDATVADRIVGRGAAALMITGGVRQVYTEVISEAALDMYAAHPEVFVDYDTITDYIINRRGDGPCPVETLTAGVSDPNECVRLIGDFLSKSCNFAV